MLEAVVMLLRPILHVKRCSEQGYRWTCEKHGWPYGQFVIPYTETTIEIIYCPVLWYVNVALKPDVSLTWAENVIQYVVGT
jgi:hypothetical protein